MKKLMIAASAALCAAVSFGQSIESANIVGYNSVALNAGGKNMVGACFVNVTSGSKVKLSELKVVGYENSSYYLGEEMSFAASFQRRSSNGMPFATYVWSDTTQDLETWDGGSWTHLQTGNPVTAENDVELNPGDGFWFTTPALQDCAGFSLTSAGQVLRGDQAFQLNAGGKIGVCNMLPTDVKLSQIEIQGYEASLYYLSEEMSFAMSMQSLMSNGMPQNTYVWSDTTQDLETWDGGSWTHLQTGTPITTENDVTVKAGEGFWATAPSLQDCTAFLFVVPKVID